MTRPIVIAVLALVALVGASTPGYACSCLSSGPPCQAFWNVDAVFVGRVTAIEAVSAKPAGFLRSRRVTFQVSEAFSGSQRGPLVVYTGQGGGDCGYPFRVGSDYVVYAQTAEGVLTAGSCSRTALLDKSAADVAYARAITSGQAMAGGITGTATFRPQVLGRKRSSADRPMPGVTVAISGPDGERRVATDTAGHFSVSDLSPGDHHLALDPPDGYVGTVFPRSVRLADPRACADVSALVTVDGHVTGRAVDADGQPLPGLTLDLLAASDSTGEPSGQRFRVLTRDDGRFEFSGIPPGRFVVAMNPPRPGEPPPGPSAFYPGVVEPPRATVTTLASGGRVALDDFVLPQAVGVVLIRGSVVGPDGAPAEGARVYLRSADESHFILTEPAISRGDGTFVLAGTTGARYQVLAERSIGDDRDRRFTVAEPLAVTAMPGMSPVVLTLRPQF